MKKAARSAAIQEATKYAALVPMQVARNAYGADVGNCRRCPFGKP